MVVSRLRLPGVVRWLRLERVLVTSRGPRAGSHSRDSKSTLAGFGSTVRELRTRANMTQQELADAAGIHRVTVSLIESGDREVGVTTVVDLAAALHVEPGDFFQSSSG